MTRSPESNEPSHRDADSRGLLTDLLILAAVFLCYFFTSYRMGEDARTVGVLALLAVLVARPRVTLSPWPWLAVLGSLLVTLWQKPLDVPNHHFMMSYLAVAVLMVLTAPPDQRGAVLRTNIRWMLIVLMGFATLHKAVSPTFLDGSYLGYEVARGGFGDPVLPLFGVDEVATENDRLAREFRATPPSDAESVTLAALTPYPATVARGFMVSILAVELLLFLGFLLAPRALISHLLLLSFIVTLGVIRQEFTFISVVSTMGLMACEPERSRLRLVYSVLAICFAAAVLKTLNGISL